MNKKKFRAHWQGEKNASNFHIPIRSATLQIELNKASLSCTSIKNCEKSSCIYLIKNCWMEILVKIGLKWYCAEFPLLYLFYCQRDFSFENLSFLPHSKIRSALKNDKLQSAASSSFIPFHVPLHAVVFCCLLFRLSSLLANFTKLKYLPSLLRDGWEDERRRDCREGCEWVERKLKLCCYKKTRNVWRDPHQKERELQRFSTLFFSSEVIAIW